MFKEGSRTEARDSKQLVMQTWGRPFHVSVRKTDGFPDAGKLGLETSLEDLSHLTHSLHESSARLHRAEPSQAPAAAHQHPASTANPQHAPGPFLPQVHTSATCTARPDRTCTSRSSAACRAPPPPADHRSLHRYQPTQHRSGFAVNSAGAKEKQEIQLHFTRVRSLPLLPVPGISCRGLAVSSQIICSLMKSEKGKNLLFFLPLAIKPREINNRYSKYRDLVLVCFMKGLLHGDYD
ncbi:uncharacterized protein LOC112986811 [Dromaius novaehollandiae]|uniref:uncharacterized protein LOC112986811 n=1 Tax=Dromaius novaehollandiae TaxID=8790 RepID=UPI00311F3C46